MNITRYIIRSNPVNTIELHQEFTHRTYNIRKVDQGWLRHLFNDAPWPAHIQFMSDGSFELEFHVSDRELPEPEIIPEVDLDTEFYIPNMGPDPNQAYYDFRETMEDFVASTRS